MLTRSIILGIAALALSVGISSSASAGGFHYSSHYGNGWNRPVYNTGYYGWGGHPRRGHLDYHDTSHFDYVPGGLQMHGNHMHYVPGGHYLHQEGHYDYHHGRHVHH